MSILYDNINNFKIFDDKYLFFDIFARNNQIILICPSYININEYISKIKSGKSARVIIKL